MTENVRKIIEEVRELSAKEQGEVLEELLALRKKRGKKSILDFVGIWHGGKALY